MVPGVTKRKTIITSGGSEDSKRLPHLEVIYIDNQVLREKKQFSDCSLAGNGLGGGSLLNPSTHS